MAREYVRMKEHKETKIPFPSHTEMEFRFQDTETEFRFHLKQNSVSGLHYYPVSKTLKRNSISTQNKILFPDYITL